jgi:RNA polymerase sigma-70 factor (ECF subfamily)
VTEKNLVTQRGPARCAHVDAEERRLLEELRSGSNVGFDRAYDAYRPRIYSFLLRMTGSPALAEDLLQEVFIKLATRASTLQADTQLKAWLFTVARNSVISHMRWRAAQSRNLEALGASRSEATSMTPQHAVEFAETHARLEMALASLAPKYREVLLLVAVEGLSPSEASSVIGIKSDALRQRLGRARQQMSTVLDRNAVTREVGRRKSK